MSSEILYNGKKYHSYDDPFQDTHGAVQSRVDRITEIVNGFNYQIKKEAGTMKCMIDVEGLMIRTSFDFSGIPEDLQKKN